MAYLFWTLVHIFGVLGFHYTSVLWFLLPNVLHAFLNMFVFVFGVATALTPNLEVEKLDEDKHKYFGYRFLMQMSIVLTGVQLLHIGYPFVAGMLVLMGSVLALSVAVQKLFNKE